MKSKNDRRLSIEPLENRSLLSALGVAPSLLFAASPGGNAAQAPPSTSSTVAATQLCVMLPPSVPAGMPVQVMAFAMGANNQPAPSYTGTAVVTSSDGGATLPPSVTFINGQASFSVTFAASGAQTLTVTDSADSVTGTASTAVGTAPTTPPTSNPTPAAATQLAIVLPPSVPSGLPVQVQALAEDANNHPVPGYTGTATLAIANGTATVNGVSLPDATVQIINGQAQFSLVFTSTGTPTLSLTDNASLLTAGTATVTVTAAPTAPTAPTSPTQPVQPVSPTPTQPTPPAPPAPAAVTQLALLVPTTVPTNTPVMVMAFAEDAHGRPVPGYTGTATLSILPSDGTVTLNGAALPDTTVSITNGQAQLPLVFSAAGSYTLTLTDNAGVLTAATAAVTSSATATPPTAPTPPAPPVAAAATQLVLILPPAPAGAQVPSGVPISILAAAQSANNQPVPSYTGTATLSISGGTATLNGFPLSSTNDTVSITNGQAQFSLVFTSVGTSVLTLTDNADVLTPASVTVVVGPTPSQAPPSGPAPGQAPPSGPKG